MHLRWVSHSSKQGPTRETCMHDCAGRKQSSPLVFAGIVAVLGTAGTLFLTGVEVRQSHALGGSMETKMQHLSISTCLKAGSFRSARQ